MAVTVGIPFFNARRTLADAIRSVFAQTYSSWELILVDDGSSDGSLELARAVRDARVRVISDGVNRGLPARLNQIINEARFDLIARMDADDMMSPRRFERQLGLFREAGVELVTCGMAMLSPGLVPIGLRSGKPAITVEAVLRGRALPHAPLMVRSEWFRRNRYDPRVLRSQDAELWARAYHRGAMKKENVRGVDEPLYFCREEAGVSLKKILMSHGVMRQLIRRYGPRSLGMLGTARELSRSHARSAALRALAAAGLLGRVTSRTRNAPITDPKVRDEVMADLEIVRSTCVPGLS